MPEQHAQTPPIDVSIVVPVYDEQDNVAELYREIAAVMDEQQDRYEAIFISDGSTDDTVSRLIAATADDPRVKIVDLRRNFGQTAAMAAGFHHARGAVIVPMDGDLQNDPRDIPRLVARLDEHGREPGKWDIVSGWRKQRQDKLLLRRFPSLIANRFIRKLTWSEEIHDFGCSMKAYRAEVLNDVTIYGEMHRFLPAICKWRGARVTEEVVNHRPRVHGKSKYNLKRTFKVLLDLMVVKFLGDYLTKAKPIYFFGKLAAMATVLAFASLALAIVQKIGYLTEHGHSVMLNDNVLVLFAMMVMLMAVMFLMLGVISELLSRIYHESQDRKPYKVRQVYVGGTDAASEPGPARSPAPDASPNANAQAAPRQTPHQPTTV